ncbi:MAG: 4-diphosphocytidyl-2-C-methyl-D-erythritol kinase [Candidatus Azotimanducaceae bacterium]|jgi:4-diphosphocytidyl-2-C-methyl-D-erythritol kinase
MSRFNFTLPAPAKLNLCLNITGRRADGYHNLQTVFQIISLQDDISFEAADDFSIESKPAATSNSAARSDFQVSLEDNLIYKAALALANFTETKLTGRIGLEKRLPMGAGLGGGSSDAATALLGLNVLWDLNLAPYDLLPIAKSLGADVPVFLMGKSAWAEGIGDELSAIELPHRYYVVIQPNCFIGTEEIFSNSQLTRDSSPITIARFLEVGSGNDCEAVARKLYPEVDLALVWLYQWGPAKMTGTGSCVFLDFSTKEEAEEVGKAVPVKWNAFVTEGLNESPLLAAVASL